MTLILCILFPAQKKMKKNTRPTIYLSGLIDSLSRAGGRCKIADAKMVRLKLDKRFL